MTVLSRCSKPLSLWERGRGEGASRRDTINALRLPGSAKFPRSNHLRTGALGAYIASRCATCRLGPSFADSSLSCVAHSAAVCIRSFAVHLDA